MNINKKIFFENYTEDKFYSIDDIVSKYFGFGITCIFGRYNSYYKNIYYFTIDIYIEDDGNGYLYENEPLTIKTTFSAHTEKAPNKKRIESNILKLKRKYKIKKLLEI